MHLSELSCDQGFGDGGVVGGDSAVGGDMVEAD